jgi:SAM-dependent methyltransferase
VSQPEGPWWQGFFDEVYGDLWGPLTDPGTPEQVHALVDVLGLRPGSKILDAPTGYGRVAIPLARRGCDVVGVDHSAALLARAEAERARNDLSGVVFLRHDLRDPLPTGGFDVALNLFSSLGYGSEEEDLTILKNLWGALRPGGTLFIETMHRDRIVALMSQEKRNALRLADGTLMQEEASFDPVTGVVRSAWYWAGERGTGVKRSEVRVYSVPELLRLVGAAGFVDVCALAGVSKVPYSQAAEPWGRLGIRAARPS